MIIKETISTWYMNILGLFLYILGIICAIYPEECYFFPEKVAVIKTVSCLRSWTAVAAGRWRYNCGNGYIYHEWYGNDYLQNRMP